MFEYIERGDPEKMYVIIGQQRWLAKHAECRESKWFCRDTGSEIQTLMVGRSIWMHAFGTQNGVGAGAGEVRPVTHFYCPDCETEPRIELGTPIFDIELTALTAVSAQGSHNGSDVDATVELVN